MPPSLRPPPVPHHLVHPSRLCPLPRRLPRPSPSPAQGSLGSGIQGTSVPRSPALGPWANHFTSLHLGFLDNKIGVTTTPSSLACFEDYKNKMHEELKPLIKVGILLSPGRPRPSLPAPCLRLAHSLAHGASCARSRKGAVMEHGPHAGHRAKPCVKLHPFAISAPPRDRCCYPRFTKEGAEAQGPMTGVNHYLRVHCWYSCIDLKHSLSTYCMPGTDLGAGKTVINQTGTDPAHMIFPEHKSDPLKILQ